MIKNKDGTYSSYGIYDGRYLSNPDRAVMFEECDTLKEARKNRADYGDGCVIVRCTMIENISRVNTFIVTDQQLIE